MGTWFFRELLAEERGRGKSGQAVGSGRVPASKGSHAGLWRVTPGSVLPPGNGAGLA